MSKEKTIVESSYDGIARNTANQSLKDREGSATIHLRQFNNWIKSTLYDRFCPSPYATVFDCACGKGGDIPKLKMKQPNTFVFGDISRESLKSAYEKYKKVKFPSRAFFIYGDTFSNDIFSLEKLKDIKFHLSSCQFAFHYAFQNEDKARSAVRNLCQKLLPGGYILLTIPNACRIVKLFRNSPNTTRVENSLFYIDRKFELDNIPPFGAEYIFNLVESVDNCPEYLVHPAVMSSLFAEYSCRLVETFRFHDFYHHALKSMPKMLELYDKLLFNNFEPADMTRDEWEVIGLYSFYVYQKDQAEKGPATTLPSSPICNVPKDKFEIINAETGIAEQM